MGEQSNQPQNMDQRQNPLRRIVPQQNQVQRREGGAQKRIQERQQHTLTIDHQQQRRNHQQHGQQPIVKPTNQTSKQHQDKRNVII